MCSYTSGRLPRSLAQLKFLGEARLKGTKLRNVFPSSSSSDQLRLPLPQPVLWAQRREILASLSPHRGSQWSVWLLVGWKRGESSSQPNMGWKMQSEASSSPVGEWTIGCQDSIPLDWLGGLLVPKPALSSPSCSLPLRVSVRLSLQTV